MKKYELSIVFHPDLEMNLDPALDKVRQILSSANANIIKETSDGKKRLAYTIKGEDYGIYYFIDVELPTDVLDKISSTLNITDEVLRFLLVRADTARATKATESAEAAEAVEAAEATDSAEAAEAVEAAEATDSAEAVEPTESPEASGDSAETTDNINKKEEQ